MFLNNLKIVNFNTKKIFSKSNIFFLNFNFKILNLKNPLKLNISSQSQKVSQDPFLKHHLLIC